MEDQSAIVLDVGSDNTKAGMSHNFPAELEPRVITPSELLVDGAAAGSSGGNSGAAHSNGGTSHTEGAKGQRLHPVVRGEIVDGDGFEALVHSCLYNQLGWELGAEGCIVMTEPVLTSRSRREWVTRLMFEVFNVAGLFFVDSASASLYAVGKTSGCVVDIGHGKVDVSTVLEGQLLSSSTRRLPYGGQDLTTLMEGMIKGRPGGPPPNAHTLDYAALKEQCAHAAENAMELERARLLASAQAGTSSSTGGDPSAAARPGTEPVTYTLPDGQEVTVRNEGLQVAEALFRPELLGQAGCPSVQAAVVSSTSTSYEGRAERPGLENILLCGGGSCIGNVGARLLSEVRALALPSLKPGLCTLPTYFPKSAAAYASWVGGAVMTKALLNQSQFISKWDYEEEGPVAGYRKCA
ncbi:hypothetical protein FOA52_009447 [Chlamydomonas sp. UWO 241]|nr:hypothetical protein FOA52_009447 [Chlamydomonas sp. UWO 241]